MVPLGSTPRSKRKLASVDSPWRRALFLIHIGMEVGTFEHDVLCSFVCAGSFTSEYSCYAHRLFLVAYCEVVLAEGVLYAVERNKFLSLVLVLDNDVMTVTMSASKQCIGCP